MDKYTATELAFKNGYEKGYEAAKAEIVHCVDCEKSGIWEHNGKMFCKEPMGCLGCVPTNPDAFCSYGKKIVKPNISKQTADALNKMGKKAHGGNDGKS
jgi:hypothetical protein